MIIGKKKKQDQEKLEIVDDSEMIDIESDDGTEDILSNLTSSQEDQEDCSATFTITGANGNAQEFKHPLHERDGKVSFDDIGIKSTPSGDERIQEEKVTFDESDLYHHGDNISNDDVIDMNVVNNDENEEYVTMDDEIEGGILKNLIQNNQNLKDRAKQISNKAKKKGKRKKSKDSGFINVEDESGSEDFVIVSQDAEKLKRGTKVGLKIIISMVSLAVLTAILAFLLLFKITPMDVQGSEKVGDFYVTPTSYVPATNNLKQGDTIIVSDQSDLIPYLFNYKEYTYVSRQGQLLTIADKEGNTDIISTKSVDYIKK